MSAHPWKCNKCLAVVFIPVDSGITEGVCTQQRRGCSGEIAKMSEREAAKVRSIITAKGLAEQAWLTVVFASKGGAS